MFSVVVLKRMKTIGNDQRNGQGSKNRSVKRGTHVYLAI